MRKIFTMLLIILMLSTPTRYSAAVGGDGGGGMVDLMTVSAFARPEVFSIVVLTSFFIASTVFSPNISILPPALRARFTLVMTAVLTLEYFKYVMREFALYFYYEIVGLSFILVPGAGDSPSPQRAQEGLWSAANPDVMTTATPVNAEKEKQEAINQAVQAALRDPELAKQYLQYATPEVQAAVSKALENQAADRARF